jgi:hypothetical protein
MCILWGLKGVLAFFGIAVFTIALVFGLDKWVVFVGTHVKQ